MIGKSRFAVGKYWGRMVEGKFEIIKTYIGSHLGGKNFGLYIVKGVNTRERV